MEFLTKIAVFYGIGAVMFGLCFASMDDVSGEWRGKPLPHPRLIGGLVAGALWPVVLLQWIFARR